MNLTSKELYVIEAIVSNCYTSNNYELPSYELSYFDAKAGDGCWTNCIDDNGAKHGTLVTGKELSGTLSSLNKKGYVGSSTGRDGVARVTELGWKAYQEDMTTISESIKSESGDNNAN